MSTTSNGSDVELDEILQALSSSIALKHASSLNGYYSKRMADDIKVDTAKAAILAWHQQSLDTAVAKAQTKVIDDIYAMSPTYQFKDWRPETAVKFYEQLKAYEAELKKQGKE